MVGDVLYIPKMGQLPTPGGLTVRLCLQRFSELQRHRFFAVRRPVVPVFTGSMVRYGEHPSPTRPTMNIHELCDDWWLARVWPRLFQAAGHPSLGPVQQLCGGSQCRCIVVRVAGAVQGPWCRGRTTFHSRTKRGKFQAAVFFKFQTFHVAFHDIPCFFFDGLKSKTRKPGSRSACQDSGDLGNLGLRVDDFVCKSGNHIDEEVVPASCVKRA